MFEPAQYSVAHLDTQTDAVLQREHFCASALNRERSTPTTRPTRNACVTCAAIGSGTEELVRLEWCEMPRGRDGVYALRAVREC